MSFDFFERSNALGQPIALYDFELGPHHWRYTNAEHDVPALGEVYEAVAISDDGMTLSGDTQNDDIVIKLPASVPFAKLFIGTPPSMPMYVTIRFKDRADEQVPVGMVCEVKAGKRVSTVEFEITCKSISSSLNRNGLRLSWGRGCPHALYDRGCKVNPALYATAIQIQGLTGNSVESSALAAIAHNYLSGGYLEFDLMAGVKERRAIERHAGAIITLLGNTDGLTVGDWIVVYPGCDRTTPTCQLKFNNLSNYGGFPHLPNKSPFDGDPVF